jgi:Fe-S-cluster containining protein
MTPEDIFFCRMCGDCCRGYGGTVVTPEDISAIAAYIGADADRFVNRYCRRSGRRYVLGQREDGYCIFWEKACTIHPVKPRMCRAWPFIPAVLVDEGNWFVMAGSCPGMRTDVSGRQIRIAVERALGRACTSKIP